MQIAADLFYRQGYRATGINEVIEKSGVAKATFYNHFPTKDDLAQAYIEAKREGELRYLDKCIAARTDPVERFLAVIDSVGPWLKQTSFRGCPFINLASEVPDPKSPLRREGMKVYDGTRARINTLAHALIDSDKKKYARLDAEELTNDYLVLMSGAIGLAEIYHAFWPTEHAEKAVRRLIGE